MHSDCRVLITGAGGFIGGRVAEVLHGLGGVQVRAGVRRWASAARIGRLPVEIVRCDLADPHQVDAACEGVTAVVQCAKATGPGDEAPLHNLLEAAHRRGVARVVHLSTTEVYGAVAGDVDEAHPVGPGQSDYARSKVAAERVCAEYIARGLPLVILRPTIVYGPFSESWTVKFVQRLLSGSSSLPEESCRGTCNLLYVDDLVAAIIAALRSDQAVGEAFNVNGNERITWDRYFRTLGDGLGVARLDRKGVLATRASACLMQPVRASARFLLNHHHERIMALYARYQPVRRLMRRAESLIRSVPSSDEFDLYGRTAFYVTGKAQRMLGYEPKFTMAQGIALSVAWLRHEGYLRNGGPA
ncbi:MAG TPA: NAD-dependent epimerase/dehydratase family protein [Gemmatimonadales bacterium]|jgi:nucleoside-diphosphate-sugar epimerase|nr:NAD-dependent epimerase/dehydratase family protein [Gemmatimonadales bacterium]